MASLLIAKKMKFKDQFIILMKNRNKYGLTKSLLKSKFYPKLKTSLFMDENYFNLLVTKLHHQNHHHYNHHRYHLNGILLVILSDERAV